MEAKRFVNSFNPYFAIIVAIPVLICCWYIIQLIEMLKVSIPGWIGGNWGWLILAGVLLCTPLWWRAYKAFTMHREERADRYAHRTLLLVAAEQARMGANLKYHNAKTGDVLELSPSDYELVPTQICEEEEPTLQIAGPQVIADVVRYEDIAHQIPADKSLLGIHPSDGRLELTSWEKLKCVWLVGSSSTGKSNTIFGKALEAVKHGAKLLVVDPHAEKEDSLARKLEPLAHAFLAPVAKKDSEILQAIGDFKQKFEDRVDGGSCSQRIVLIADEVNRMARNDTLKKPLQEIVAICGEESRGFGMYGWFLSQKATHLKWLRDSAITVIAHRVTRIEEAMLICNEDRQAAKALLKFKVGRTFIYGVDFEDGLELQQVLYSFPTSISTSGPTTGPLQFRDTDETTIIVDEDACEVSGSGQVSELSEEEKKIVRLFMAGRNPSQIVKDLYPSVSGGVAYQKASVEISDAIRKALLAF